MPDRTPPTANKTSWSKQSAVLLINIVMDVEQKILKKELLVGKENEKTKWDYVAAFLHEASPGDAGKTPNSCQYKFWELNRQYKFLTKKVAGKGVREEKAGATFLALKAYYGNSPPVEKKSRLQRKNALFKECERQPTTENPPQLIGNPSQIVPSRDNDARCESRDDTGGSLRHSTHTEDPIGHLATSNPAVEQFEDNAGSPLHHPNVEVAEQVRRPRGRPKGKRKAIDLENLDLKAEMDKGNNSNRLNQIVDKMARLTSYMKWKQTGVGEDWRCVLTDRIERRHKRSTRTPVKSTNQHKAEETEAQVPDEIESALREDILSCWNELDQKRPSAEECHNYFVKKCAGEVYW